MPRRTNNLSTLLSAPTGVGISELFPDWSEITQKPNKTGAK
jgi:hypothetical protein